MESLNRMALGLIEEAFDFGAELGVGGYELENDATVVDFGVEERGGIDAGLLLAEIQTAGLATLRTRMGTVAGTAVPYVELTCDHPALGLFGAQRADWELAVGAFEGLASGPGRAQLADCEAFAEAGYDEPTDETVLVVESGTLPSADVASAVADRAGVDTENVILAVAPTASVPGSLLNAARGAELALARLHAQGYELGAVRTVSGSVPLPPVAASEREAIARTNDALAYGGRAHLTLTDPFDATSELVSSAPETDARPFAEILDDVDWNGSELPGALFAPAQVTVDVMGGATAAAGDPDEQLLAESFGL